MEEEKKDDVPPSTAQAKETEMGQLTDRQLPSNPFKITNKTGEKSALDALDKFKELEVLLKPAKLPQVAFMELYKYSTSWERWVVRLGLFFSVLAGATMPTYCIVIGRVVEMFDPDIAEKRHEMLMEFFWITVIICIFSYVSSYLGYTLMQISAERLSFKLRARYLDSLMRQEVKYFEEQSIEALPSQLSEWFTHITEGSGEKMGQLIQTLGSTVSGIIIGLAVCPIYSLILLVYLPIATVLMKWLQKQMITGIVRKFTANAKLGAFSEEMLSSLKLIVSFGREQVKLAEYKAIVEQAYKESRRSAIINGFAGGAFYGTMIGFSCFSWFVGFFMIKYEMPNPRYDRPINVSDIVTTYQGLLFGMFTVLQIQGLFPTVIRSLTSGYHVLKLIEREPEIQSPKDKNECVSDIKIGEGISFNKIRFRYPTAPEHLRDVFNGANFQIKAGTSTAIVGPSGAGKSTIVQMLNRFYDPLEGEITYGTTPLKKIDLKSLREIIGWVGQEPVLIVGTIRQNLLYGNKDASEDELERAINQANAQFIYQMEKKLDTYVGSSTVLNLSGGQKQRIAIARALIKRPQILVLDEATSALDPRSEAEVQSAILKVQKQQSGDLTIIMIAHRLQTILTADNLLYLEGPDSVLSASKGTKEYNKIIDRLMRTNYAHQVDNVKEEGKIDTPKALNDSDEEVKEEQKDAKQLMPEEKATAKFKIVPVDEVEVKAPAVTKLETFISQNAGWGRLYQYYVPRYLVIFMVLLAMVASTGMPGVAYFIIRLQYAFYSHEVNDEWESEATVFLGFEASWIFMIAIVVGFEKALFGAMGEKMTYTLRLSLIEEILHKQIAWFDTPDRAPGILSNVIASDIASLNGMTSEVLVTIFELICIFTLGTGAGIYFCWQASILCAVCSPIMIIGMFKMSRMVYGVKGGRVGGDDGQDSYAQSNALLSDVIINYRTVISLGQKNVDSINNRFQILLHGPLEEIKRQSNKMGLYYALGVAGRTLYVSVAFMLGIEFLVVRWEIHAESVFTAIYLMFFTYMSIGGHAANVPSIKKAKASAIPVFSIIDEVSTLDVRKPAHRTIKEVKAGKIEFKDVTFKYPTRIQQKVMDQFSIEIPAAGKIALVGHSGCGKSTLTNILLRFYNIDEGKVLIDGEHLDNYDVLALRETIGYVMQEPILFNADIKTNIRFGKPDASDEEVYIAAQKANALQFIEDTSTTVLTEAEQLENLQNDLRSVFDASRVLTPQLANMHDRFVNDSKDAKQLLLDVMTNADTSVLQQANDRVEDFEDAIRGALKKYGASWEDVVIRFEWQKEYVAVQTSSQSDTLISQMLEKYPELYACFDPSSLIHSASKLTDFESLASKVRQDHQQYRMKVSKRFSELQYKAIDKKRGPDGSFKLHEGFDKECGPKGGKLSGGQKQRIAIARALIKDPKILILDEATSALDEHSQEVVQIALDRAMEGRTSIVIAHRLSTIRNCDQLFLLGDGKVVETGSYKELSDNPDSKFNALKSGMEN